MFVICYFHRLQCEHLNRAAGNQIEQDIQRWFSPSDPSTNHNPACGVYHNAPPMWFFEAGVFKGWISSGSFLWVHGKCTFLPNFAAQLLMVSLLT